MLARPLRRRTSGPPGPTGTARGRQRDHGLEGRQRLGREPDRLQLPRAARARPATRSGGTGAPNSGQIDGHGYYGAYLSTTSTFYQDESSAARVRGLLQQLGPAGPGIRSTPRTSMTRASTSAPASRSAIRRSTTAGRSTTPSAIRAPTPAGILVIENSTVRPQRGWLRHQQPERRFPAAAGRGVSERRDEPDQPYAFLLGVHGQLRARQQQPQRPRGRLRRGRSGRHRHVDLRRSQRHGHEQHVCQQRRLGRDRRALPRQHDPALHRGDPGPGRVRVRRVRRRRSEQQVHP